jgi:hypothetical protein
MSEIVACAAFPALFLLVALPAVFVGLWRKRQSKKARKQEKTDE